MVAPRRLGDYEGRGLFAHSLPSFMNWPPGLAGLDSAELVLFVGADARGVPDDVIREAARRAIASGLCYLVAWGPECERVHDLFDHVIVHEHFRGTETVANVIMTTWHNDESLADALWFFLQAASPAQDYGACRSWVAVTIGSPDWAREVERALRDPAGFVAGEDEPAAP